MLQAHFDKAQFDVTRSTDGEVEKLRVLKCYVSVTCSQVKSLEIRFLHHWTQS